MVHKRLRLVLAACLISATCGVFSRAQTPTPSPSAMTTALGNLSWRSIGPANMGGRVSDIEGVPGNPNIVYVATGAGGIFKTVNAGNTWTPLFDRQNTISVGDIALEPGNPDVIWVGTGESNVRNSVSFGDGVYKSTDGGKTGNTWVCGTRIRFRRSSFTREIPMSFMSLRWDTRGGQTMNVVFL